MTEDTFNALGDITEDGVKFVIGKLQQKDSSNVLAEESTANGK